MQIGLGNFALAQILEETLLATPHIKKAYCINN